MTTRQVRKLKKKISEPNYHFKRLLQLYKELQYHLNYTPTNDEIIHWEENDKIVRRLISKICHHALVDVRH